MSEVYRQDRVELATGQDPVGEAVRLLQVLNGRAREVQVATGKMYDSATFLPFADYADGFRRVQEFLSFCDVIESKLNNIAATTREPILREVIGIKIRAYYALLRGMGAYLTALDRRGVINYFAQAVFLMQQDALTDFRQHVKQDIPRDLSPDMLGALEDEVLQRLKRLLDRCVDVPDFRFAP